MVLFSEVPVPEDYDWLELNESCKDQANLNYGEARDDYHFQLGEQFLRSGALPYNDSPYEKEEQIDGEASEQDQVFPF